MNNFYNASGNPGTGSEGLSALLRAEFAAIAIAFDLMPNFATTGVFETVFAQQGNYTFTLPASAGTLAMLSDVAIETAARTAADVTNTTAIGVNAAAIAANSAADAAAIAAANAAMALLAPMASPTLTGTVTIPTPTVLDNSTKAVNSTWVAAYLAASGYAPTGASPVTSVAARTGVVTLTHADLTDWAATLAPYALLASPALTGTPTAPTAAPGTNTTQVATTAYATAAVAAEAAARGVSEALLAPKASPAFTGTVNGAAAVFSGAVAAASYGPVVATTGAFSGAITQGGVAVVLNNGATYGISISGTAAGCSGNSVTATTAVNQNGGTVHATTINSSGAAAFAGSSSSTAPNIGGAAATVHIVPSTACFMAAFQYGPGNTVGTIGTNGSSVSYNATSDYRLKTTFGRWLDGTAFDRVRVHDSAYKTAPDIRRPMFLAHELQDAGFGFVVTGEKNGKAMQMVDHPALVPALWAMVQDLRRRVAALEG